MIKYNAIYVDAPAGKGGTTVERLKRLPLREICQEDALLFLWFPPSEFMAYLSVLDVWGFRYGRLLTWFDRTPEAQARGCYPCTYLLVGIRGEVPAACFEPELLHECPAEQGDYHSLLFRDMAVQVADRAFFDPVLMDVFGKYWHGLDAEYGAEEWEFGEFPGLGRFFL